MARKLEDHNYFGIDATIIAHSRNEFGDKIVTFVATFPRIVLAEFNTHRMLSRNSASSRAVPFEKMFKRVEENPFIPIKWMKDHKGMQGNEFFEKPEEINKRVNEWLKVRDYTIKRAKELNQLGVTKQIVNRLLEPFMWHTVIVTGTDWENFTALRADPPAEIHIQDLAYKMIDELNASTPKQLKAGEWHIPFGDNIDEDRLDFTLENGNMASDYVGLIEKTKVKIATARCARVSYFNFEGKDDYEADIKLYDRLSKVGHWSPFEHCAKAMDYFEYDHHCVDHYNPKTDRIETEYGRCGNFRGFIQLRKTFENENRKDKRIR